MAVKIEAVFDGRVFLPIHPITLKANTRVQISVVTDEQPVSFLDVAESLALGGPPDWSLQLDERFFAGQNRIACASRADKGLPGPYLFREGYIARNVNAGLSVLQ